MYLNKKNIKKGSIAIAINQVIKGIQFFFVLKILVLLKASLYRVSKDGFIKSPFSLAQPYDGS